MFPFLFLPRFLLGVFCPVVSSVSVSVSVSLLLGRLMSFRDYSSPVSSWSSPVFSLQFQPGLFLETRSWSKWDWTATLIDVWWPFSSLASLLLGAFSWPLRVRGSVAWLQLWPASHLENGRKTGQLGWSLRILPNKLLRPATGRRGQNTIVFISYYSFWNQPFKLHILSQNTPLILYGIL